ncbi:major histocompatibility complex class I-related gene protein-like [Astyanax mexicanus]|uniref:major histocompatibility complex class I-related gene protein-like n=1 Tax=Astyanax mexicanus TaxID=7994 RepID=UPI0020CB0D65|nr:major histocompatibility complex class I-related gene protein-like [Astyanax mexicanus]
MIKILIFLIFTPQLTSAATHSLRYISTAVTWGTPFPEYTVLGLLDGWPFELYDSNIRKVTPKTEWIQRNAGADFWSRESDAFKDEQEWSLANMAKTMMRHNTTNGIHTWQWAYGCDLDDNGTTTGYSGFAYDGQDYIRLDLKTGTFTAYINSFLLNWSEEVAAHCKLYLQTECVEDLKSLVRYSQDTLKKGRPEVSVFQKDYSSPVVCHATGFFPKAVMISWQKNGEDLNEDVELRQTLPNQDGTFQKRSILTVSPEELKNNNYTCVVQHEGMEKEIVLQVSDCRVLLDRGSVGVIIGVVLAVLLLVILLGFAGVLMWKKRKKNSGK